MKIPGLLYLYQPGASSPAALGSYDPHPYMFLIIVAPRFCRILEIRGGNDDSTSLGVNGVECVGGDGKRGESNLLGNFQSGCSPLDFLGVSIGIYLND
jgi:hypothetical protein